MKLICVYLDENGNEHREEVSPGEAISIIRNGHKNPSTAKIYATDGTLKGERQPLKKGAITGNPYYPWWHDDDLNQLELLPEDPV